MVLLGDDATGERGRDWRVLRRCCCRTSAGDVEVFRCESEGRPVRVGPVVDDAWGVMLGMLLLLLLIVMLSATTSTAGRILELLLVLS